MCSNKLQAHFSDHSNKQGFKTCFGHYNKDTKLKEQREMVKHKFLESCLMMFARFLLL